MRKILFIVFLASGIWCQGQTIGEVRAEIQRQGLPHPEIVLAQARLETGNFTSTRCKRDKNILGIKHGTRYAVYRRWQDCVSDYKKRVSNRYTGGDYYQFLRRIGYATDEAYCRKVANIVRTSK